MRTSIHDLKRIELIPETDDEKTALQAIIHAFGQFGKVAGRAESTIVYWGDAGENFEPAEMLGGMIVNAHTVHKDLSDPVLGKLGVVPDIAEPATEESIKEWEASHQDANMVITGGAYEFIPPEGHVGYACNPEPGEHDPTPEPTEEDPKF